MSDPAQIIRGHVFHERLRPANNRFTYPVFCLRVNLAHLERIKVFGFALNRWAPVAIHNKDYGPKDGSRLEPWIRQLLKTHNVDATGDIWLQTFPRVFGFVFNPVSFWYCYDPQGGLRAVLAEVNNTFGETHHYLIAGRDNTCIDSTSLHQALKTMHVSPFCEVNGHYQFRFSESVVKSETKAPSQAPSKSSHKSVVHKTSVTIDYFDKQGLLIKTAIGGTRAPLTRTSLWRALGAQPLLTLGVFTRIHWQAFLLWRKRVPFFSKPAPPSSSITTASLITSSLSTNIHATALETALDTPRQNKERQQ